KTRTWSAHYVILRERDDRQPLGSDDHAKLPQPLDGRVEGLVFLAEAEPDMGLAERLVVEEARAGDGGDAEVADEVPREGDVVAGAEGFDAGHDVVGAVGGLEVEADVDQGRAEAVAPRLVIGGELGVV